MKIYLVGMPGSGKTTLGKKLAEKLILPFVDLDVEIENREGKTITNIFAQQGEDYFRLVESTLLREWAASSQSFVMATGGGAPCFHNGMNVINESGLSVFLDLDIVALVKRLKSANDRPLLGTDLTEKEEKLRKLRAARLACYSQAKIKVQNPDINKVLQAIRLED